MPINTLYPTWFQRIRELQPNQRLNQIRSFGWLMTGKKKSGTRTLDDLARDLEWE